MKDTQNKDSAIKVMQFCASGVAKEANLDNAVIISEIYINDPTKAGIDNSAEQKVFLDFVKGNGELIHIRDHMSSKTVVGNDQKDMDNVKGWYKFDAAKLEKIAGMGIIQAKSREGDHKNQAKVVE